MPIGGPGLTGGPGLAGGVERGFLTKFKKIEIE
jgi:hypothetical protein